ncbi:hypothetical protein D3C71_1714480 [compost metagenome]
MFSVPAGTPASIASSAMRSSDSGVNSLGLSTMVQPQVSAEAIFQRPIISEKFHGVMPATTPTASRRVKAAYCSPWNDGSDGVMVWPWILVAQPAK